MTLPTLPEWQTGDQVTAEEMRQIRDAIQTGVLDIAAGVITSNGDQVPTTPEVTTAFDNVLDKATFDPTSVEDDAFAMDNMVEGATTKILTDAERTKLGGLDGNAEPNNISDADALELTGGGETTLHSHPLVNVYGTDRVQDAEAAFTTTSNDFDTPNASNDKLTVVTSGLPVDVARKYQVVANAQYFGAKDARHECGIWHVEAADWLVNPIKYKSDENNDQPTITFRSADFNVSGVNTFILRYGPEMGGNDMSIGNAVLTFMRVE